MSIERKKLTFQEARKIALQWMHDLEEQRKYSCVIEARELTLQGFSTYGEDALWLGVHLSSLTDEEFQTTYQTDKATVRIYLKQLERADQEKDYITKNKIRNYFIELLNL